MARADEELMYHIEELPKNLPSKNPHTPQTEQQTLKHGKNNILARYIYKSAHESPGRKFSSHRSQ